MKYILSFNDKVKKLSVIGGLDSGLHLHFAIRLALRNERGREGGREGGARPIIIIIPIKPPQDDVIKWVHPPHPPSLGK
jgi:hypothetical protein